MTDETDKNVKMVEPDAPKRRGERTDDAQSDEIQERLTGAEEVRKFAEDYEYEPAKNLKPPTPEQAANQQTDRQETQQE